MLKKLKRGQTLFVHHVMKTGGASANKWFENIFPSKEQIWGVDNSAEKTAEFNE